MFISVTCDLDDGNTAIFDVPDTEADDHDDTWMLFDLFTRTVGA